MQLLLLSLLLLVDVSTSYNKPYSLLSSVGSESRSRRRLEFPSSNLKGKKFYLHLQSAAKARNLEREVTKLGGVVEKFLSKDVTCVITDQTSDSQKTTSLRREVRNAFIPGPSQVQTRAQAILQRSVRQNKQPTKSTDVITNAKKWGIQVKPVEQVLKWIAEQKNRPGTSNAQTPKTTNRVRKLKGSFLKVEDHSRQYQPLVKQLQSWPRLNPDAPPGLSPFDEPVSMRTRSRSSSKTPRKGAKQNTTKQLPGSSAKIGYCELCYVNYEGMAKHIASKLHRMVAAQEHIYAELDRLIERGKSLKEYEAKVRDKIAAEEKLEERKTRSQTPRRSPRTPKPTAPETKGTRGVPVSSSRGVAENTRKGNSWNSSASGRTPSINHRSPSSSLRTTNTTRRSRSSSRRSTNNKYHSPSSRQTSNSNRYSPTTSRRTPNSGPRSSPRTLIPVKLIRSQGSRYSVARSAGKKRNRVEMNRNNSSTRAKRIKSDRYKIVESTPTRIRLRQRRRQQTSSNARNCLFSHLPHLKNPSGRSP